MRLGVNIDHIATLRQARQDVYPDLLTAAKIALENGADGITVHLREDRRHIQDDDVIKLRKAMKKKHLNLEMAAVMDIANFALKVKPDAVCIVPEKRQEITTEGGLDVFGNLSKIRAIIKKLNEKQIKVSLFIDPDKKQIDSAKETGAEYIELHTGEYAEFSDPKRPYYDKKLKTKQLNKLLGSARYARSLGLKVNAGHGLTYKNVCQISKYKNLFEELNIGHNIIAEAIFVGLATAVRTMKKLIK
jgi:pyridoxine 5-phosphate synthase